MYHKDSFCNWLNIPQSSDNHAKPACPAIRLRSRRLEKERKFRRRITTKSFQRAEKPLGVQLRQGPDGSSNPVEVAQSQIWNPKTVLPFRH